MSEAMMKQCRLRRRDETGLREQVAWIGVNGARVGACVELIDEGGLFWEVVEVYDPPLSGRTIREKQRMDRGALSSIK